MRRGPGDAGRACGHDLPPSLAVDVRPATGRFGLFVGRRLAFGFDLYAAGRRARLPLEGGGVITAQAHLERAWEAARAALGPAASPDDLDAGDRMVAGSSPLGIETRGDDDRHPAPPPPTWSPFGEILRDRGQAGVGVAAVAATWDFTVFRLDHARRTAYACVPTPWLERFLHGLDGGALDGLLADFLGGGSSGRVLRVHDQTREPGLWDDAVIGPDLLPDERTADEGVPRGSSPLHARPGKLGRVPGPPAPLFAEPASRPPLVPAESASAALVAAEPKPRPESPPVAEPAGAPKAGEPAEDSIVRKADTVPTARNALQVPSAVERAPSPAAPVPAGVPPVEPTLRPRPRAAQARPRRRVRVLVALLSLLLGGTAAAVAVVIAGGGDSGVDVRTSPSVPPPTVVRRTTTPPASTTSADPTSTAAPTTPVATAAPTLVPRSTAGATAVPATDPATTIPPETTVPPTSEPPTTVSTVVVDPPTDVVVAVVKGPRGCAFQPASITVVVGSTVAFRNATDVGLTIVIGGTTISLDSGGSSGPYPLATAGTSEPTCTPDDGTSPGDMTITVTGG